MRSYYRKSQASLEFLTTYAWAFIVIIVMIAALSYFGILNPSKILPSRCNFGIELECKDFTINYDNPVTPEIDGTVRIRMKNGFGEAITIPDMAGGDITISTEAVALFTCATQEYQPAGGSVPIPFQSTPVTWRTDALMDFIFTECNTADVGFTKGNKGKVDIIIRYHLAKSDPSFLRQVEGDVYTTVI